MIEPPNEDERPRWHRPLLIAIFAIGLAVRIAALDSSPPGLYIDEASFGYNAYSILKTGRDEFGNYLPLYTASFGGGKNPVYLYATVPFVAALGLTETAVRLPAAIFGALAVLMTYYLAASLTGRRGIGYLAALFLALNPWHIFFSRFAVEETSMVFFLTLGLWLLIRGLKQPHLIPWSGAALGVSLYTYAAAIPFVPLILLSFAVFYRKQLSPLKKQCATAAAILFLFALPHVLPGIKTAEQNEFFKRNTIFNPINDDSSRELLDKSQWPLDAFADSRPGLMRAATFTRNYLAVYSPNFLFFNGDLSTWRARVKGHGAFYRVFIPVLLAGLALLVLSRRPEHRLMLAWFLIYPLGAAITVHTYPQATRSITALPLYQIIFATVIVLATDTFRRQLYSNISSLARFTQKLLILLAAAGIIMYFYCSASFLNNYFTQYPKYASYDWNAGFREVFQTADQIKDDYYEVVVTRNIPYSYIYILFYTRYDPAALHRLPLRREIPGRNDSYPTGKIDRYVIRDPYLQYGNKPQLFITGFWERPDLPEIPIEVNPEVPLKVKLVEYRP